MLLCWLTKYCLSQNSRAIFFNLCNNFDCSHNSQRTFSAVLLAKLSENNYSVPVFTSWQNIKMTNFLQNGACLRSSFKKLRKLKPENSINSACCSYKTLSCSYIVFLNSFSCLLAERQSNFSNIEISFILLKFENAFNS